MRRQHRVMRIDPLAAPRDEEHAEVSLGEVLTQRDGVGQPVEAQERQRGQLGGDLGLHSGLGFFLWLLFLSSAGRSWLAGPFASVSEIW